MKISRLHGFHSLGHQNNLLLDPFSQEVLLCLENSYVDLSAPVRLSLKDIAGVGQDRGTRCSISRAGLGAPQQASHASPVLRDSARLGRVRVSEGLMSSPHLTSPHRAAGLSLPGPGVSRIPSKHRHLLPCAAQTGALCTHSAVQDGRSSSESRLTVHGTQLLFR